MNETQVDLTRLGEVEYMCQLGDALGDCGIRSIQWDEHGRIVEIEMCGTREQDLQRQREAWAQQEVGYAGYLNGEPAPDPKRNKHRWYGWRAAQNASARTNSKFAPTNSKTWSKDGDHA